MLSITDNYLYIIDSDGRQQLFDVDKLKSALQDAFAGAGNPNGYLAEDIVCAVEAAMQESLRSERIFTRSEVDAAVSRILENAGCAGVAKVFRRANSHLYIALDANEHDANMLITRHLGLQEPAAGRLAKQVVNALKTLNIKSASPALYLELARYYEHNDVPHLTAVANDQKGPAGAGKMLLTANDITAMVPENLRKLWDGKIITLSPVSRLYPNFRLSLNLYRLSEYLHLSAPVTELELAPMLYSAGEKTGLFLNLLCQKLDTPQLPLYLVLTQLDLFAENHLGTTYPEGRVTALDVAALFRNALDYPVKKVRCRTSTANKNTN